MVKLGVILDGVSRDLDHALSVMGEFGLWQAELQYIGDLEVGDLTPDQIGDVAERLAVWDCQVSCISRHVFAGLPVLDTAPDSPEMRSHLQDLSHCIDMAQQLRAPLVRIMSFRKEMILFGDNGAEEWVVTTGAWDRLLTLMEPAVRMAEERGQTLVVETGNGGMVCSAALARRLVDDLGRPDRLQVLWDPCNSLYAGEPPYPEGYSQLRNGYLGHIHIKDAAVDPARARVSCCPLGLGDMAPYLQSMVTALERDGYAGSVSLESVYRPRGGTFEDGFRQSVETFTTLFNPSGAEV